MPSFFTRIDLNPDLNLLRFSADTRDVMDLDDSVRRFVEAATEQCLSPSIFELCGCAFPVLIPANLHGAPLWLVWLGEGNEQELAELAGARPEARVHASTDLMKLREMLVWNTQQHSYCAGARGLRHSLNAASGSAVLVVFLTPNALVSTPMYINDELLEDLDEMSEYCGVAYFPHQSHTREERERARMESVLFGNERKLDGEGRDIILLKTRQLPHNW